MYDHISGELVRKELTEAVVRAGGVGYAIAIPVSTYEAIPSSGPVILYTHLAVRENDMRLYGFATERERVFFRILLNAKGIGPATALAIMSAAQIAEFTRAVVEEDHEALERVRGIGAKTARRIVAEIRDDIEEFRERYVAAGAAGGADARTKDAVAALVNLGFPRAAAEKGVERARAARPDAGVEELVKEALKNQ